MCTYLNLSLCSGLTPQYAFLLKMTAMTRAELVKALKLSYPDNENVSKRCTGKSLSEALIFASINPQYDNRLFMELP